MDQITHFGRFCKEWMESVLYNTKKPATKNNNAIGCSFRRCRTTCVIEAAIQSIASMDTFESRSKTSKVILRRLSVDTTRPGSYLSRRETRAADMRGK